VTALLDVRVEIAAEREGDLNEWYARHLPHLMQTPGYTSGRRYLALDGGPRYAALYEIEHESFLPSLLGEDSDARHELTLIDLPAWDSDLVPYMTRSDFNVWETAASHHAPVLAGNHPVVHARFDASDHDEDAVVRYCDEELLPALATDPDVVAATRLRPSADPAVAWIATQPSAFVLVQVSGERTALELTGGESPLRRLSDRPGVSALEVSAYRQLLYHAPFGGRS
jgi:hypothetical protein